MGASTYGECVGAMMDRAHPSILQKAVDDGRSTFDLDSVLTCVADVRATSCDTLADVIQLPYAYVPSCHDVLQGPESNPADCEGSWECNADSFCFKASEDSCLGTCTQTAGLYTLCGAANCGVDEMCDYSTDTCVPRGGDGAECRHSGECLGTYDCLDGQCTKIRRGEVGSYCGQEWACDVGLGCRSGECIELPGPGEQCTQFACPRGYRCTGTCEERSESGSCSSDEECVSNDCHSGTCRPPLTGCRDL